MLLQKSNINTVEGDHAIAREEGMTYIKLLDRIARSDIDQVGGKAARLGELIQARFPVPRGFCLAAQAYHDFVVHNDLQSFIQEILAETQFDDIQSLRDSSARLVALFTKGEVPAPVVSALQQAYGPLENRTVAVRSSATAEDMPEASFAGQHETYLGVLGFQELVERIKDCWASLWTERAMLYRARQGWVQSQLAMAVMVQEMVASDVAGILFTANPLTGESGELVINASWGLGEAIVAGTVSPDTYILDKEANLRRVEVGSKERQSVLTDQGVVSTPVTPDKVRLRCLDDEQLAALVQLGGQIEGLFDAAQDIEWALAEGQFYVLQARPITALPQPVPTYTQAQPFDLWTRANVGEVFPGVISPLLWSVSKQNMSASIRWTLRGLRVPGLDQFRFFDLFYGRIYFNEGAVAHIFSKVVGLPQSFIETSLGTKLTAPLKEGADRYKFGKLLRRLPGLLRSASYARKAGILLEREFPHMEQEAKMWREKDLSGMTDVELLQTQRSFGVAAQERYRLYNSVNAMAVNTFSSLQDLVKRLTGESVAVSDLVTGLRGIKTAEIAPTLWRIAQQIRTEPELLSILSASEPLEALEHLRQSPKGEAVARQIDDFLADHGHHCTDEYEIMTPRWVEAPTFIVHTLLAYAQAGDEVNPLAFAERQGRIREAAVAKVESLLRRRWIDKLFPFRLMVFRNWLKSAQRYTQLRENGKHYVLMLTYIARRIFVEVGRHWAAEGWLQQAEDIFFLDWEQVDSLAKTTDRSGMVDELGRKIAARRLERTRYQSFVPPDVIVPGQPLSVRPETVASAGQILQGIGVSAGQVEGTARVILDPSEGRRLKAGEILVTRFTDPGWTPLFALASGVVMDAGGLLSHGSIVAREYGVPAVVNVAVATREIKDGTKIVVDGSRGEVYLQRE